MKGPQDQVVSQENCEFYRVAAGPKFAAAFSKLFEHMSVVIMAGNDGVSATSNGVKPPIVVTTFIDGSRKLDFGDGPHKLVGLDVTSISTESYSGRIIKVHVDGDCPFAVTCRLHNADSKLLTKPQIVHHEEPSAPASSAPVAIVQPVVDKPPLASQGAVVLPKRKSALVEATKQVEQQVKVSPSAKDIRVALIPIDEIAPFEGQPREEFDERELKSLAVSLKTGRQRQMITVKPIRGIPGKNWELVDGERRWRAAKEAGVKSLYAIVKEYDSLGDQYWDSFIMNLQRQGHTPLELSDAFAQAIKFGKTVTEICAETGYSNAMVYQHLHIQSLHPDLRDLMRMSVLKQDRLRMSLAHKLARVPDKDEQLRVYNEVRDEPNPRIRELKALKLLRPILDKLPHKGRKRGLHDRVVRFVRVMAIMEGNLGIMDDMSGEDLKCLLSSETPMQDPVVFINKALAELTAFKVKLIKARTELRKKKD